MNVRPLLNALAVIVFFSSQNIPAQDNLQPKESTATLERTLSWLGRHFETNFTYGYSIIESSGGTATASHYESVVKRAPLRFEDCDLSWRDSDEVVRVSLSALDPLSVVVLLHAERNMKLDSDVWQLAVGTRDRKKSVAVRQANETIQSRNSVTFLYDDKENADKFARALQHAIKLCSQQVPSGP